MALQSSSSQKMLMRRAEVSKGDPAVVRQNASNETLQMKSDTKENAKIL